MKRTILFIFSLSFTFSCTKVEKETIQPFPIVTTEQVTNIHAGKATFNGSFLQAGNSEIIDHGFVFSTYNAPTIQYAETISLGASSGSGSFTAVANYGMTIGETYWVCAYAKNKEKIFYADPVSFVCK